MSELAVATVASADPVDALDGFSHLIDACINEGAAVVSDDEESEAGTATPTSTPTKNKKKPGVLDAMKKDHVLRQAYDKHVTSSLKYRACKESAEVLFVEDKLARKELVDMCVSKGVAVPRAFTKERVLGSAVKPGKPAAPKVPSVAVLRTSAGADTKKPVPSPEASRYGDLPQEISDDSDYMSLLPRDVRKASHKHHRRSSSSHSRKRRSFSSDDSSEDSSSEYSSGSDSDRRRRDRRHHRSHHRGHSKRSSR